MSDSERQVFHIRDQDKEKLDREAHDRTSRLDWLKAYRDRRRLDQIRYRGLEARWSAVRLIVFAAGIAIVILLRHDVPTAILVGIAAAAAFLGAVWQHARWQNRHVAVERLLLVIEESLFASTHRDRPVRAWQRPSDAADSSPLPTVFESGPTWNLTEQEQDDLDLYAPPVGIFGLLNRTSTPLGARRLRDRLETVCLSCEPIRQRQHAIRWLDEHPEQRLKLMAALVSLRDHSRHLDNLARLLGKIESRPPSRVSQGVRLWSVFSGILFAYGVLSLGTGQYIWVRPLSLLLIINIAIGLILRPMLGRRNAWVSAWAPLPETLRCLLSVAQCAVTELPDEAPLGALKESLRQIILRARIPSLCTWLEWAGAQGMVRGLLNLWIFLDLHIAEAVQARVGPNRDLLLRGLSALAETETMCSLATFSAELPQACYPQPQEDPGCSLQDGRHPLLLHEGVTPNSVFLAPDKRTWVITGPNAAGKSTFLRMVGVNLVLAQMGAAVAAGAMRWSPVRLITDVRIRDDLARNESYFLSEVRRLRRLVVDAENHVRILGLIDEPFRGTNSQERVAAGVALLEHLMTSCNFFLVATHEQLLAQIAANTTSAENYHFQEQLHEDGIAFDYRLRPGPATTRTALHILEREGYPPSLLERARHLITDSTQSFHLT